METPRVGILSLLTFLPLFGAGIVLLLPHARERLIKQVGLGVSLAAFALSLVVYGQFKGGTYHFQLQEYLPWIPTAGIHYRMGIDGISIWLVLLTTFLTVICFAFSFYVEKRVKPYIALFLMLETAMLGVFLSLDMILFYTFFEFSLIPMYFLISIWGGERKAYASLKFFIYTFAGSIFMLVGMIALAKLHHDATGMWSFSVLDIQEQVASGRLWANAMQLQPILFYAFLVAFLVKTPAFPFHTWLPDAHTEAPTAGSVILAGVLLKMGTYGMLRFCLPLFPDTIGQQVPIVMLLGVVGILYGAIVSAVQPDLKKLIAYSSVAHMGFILVGIFSLTHRGLMGGSFQQLAHGISTGALFLLVGLLYERRHTRMFRDFGGLKAQMPIFAALFLIVMLSSVGLPGTNGFIGEFLALMGAWESSFAQAYGLNVVFAVLAASGVILAAVYLLYMFQQVFYGPNANPENQRLKDLKPWEIGLVGLLVVFVFWGGLYPNTFFAPKEKAIGAARLMAIAPPGERPVWKDATLEIDEKLNLVFVGPRTAEQVGETFTAQRTITDGRLHYRLPYEVDPSKKSVGEGVQAALSGGSATP